MFRILLIKTPGDLCLKFPPIIMLLQKRFLKCIVLISLFISASGLNVSLDYESFLRPNHGAVADICNVSIKMITIREINANNNKEMTLDFILNKGWTDPRLQNLVKKATIFVSDFPHNIWMPDLYIVNSFSLRRPEEFGRSFRLKPEGELSLNERLVARIHCPSMSFAKFPFDKHTCQLKLQSYAYNIINLDLLWNGLISNSDVQIADPHFHLVSISQTSLKESIETGQYTSLVLQITVRRCGMAYLTNVIIPLALLLVMSYLTLLIKSEETVTIKEEATANGNYEPTESNKKLEVWNSLIPICVSGLAFSLAVVIGQMSLIKTPTTSIITALDVWIFVISFIIALIFVLSLSNFIFLSASETQQEQKRNTINARNKLNVWLIKGIPVFFIIYSVIYFVVYLT